MGAMGVNQRVHLGVVAVIALAAFMIGVASQQYVVVDMQEEVFRMGERLRQQDTPHCWQEDI
jgi:hypothetical protein